MTWRSCWPRLRPALTWRTLVALGGALQQKAVLTFHSQPKIIVNLCNFFSLVINISVRIIVGPSLLCNSSPLPLSPSSPFLSSFFLKYLRDISWSDQHPTPYEFCSTEDCSGAFLPVLFGKCLLPAYVSWCYGF